MNTMNKVLIFVAGAAIGSLATWKLVKTKYERMMKDEIESVREVYARKTEEIESKKDDEEESTSSDSSDENIVSKKEKDEYVKIANEYRSEDDKVKIDDTQDYTKPYRIPPEEFGECGYDIVSFDYYADGVLVDEYGDIVENIEEVVGDACNYFGEYEDDSVFVRDDDMHVDYEILADVRNYKDLVERNGG